MFLILFIELVLVVVIAVVVAALVATWWVTVSAAVVLIAATIAGVLLILHYVSAPGWLGASDEAELQEADLVETETGLPKRERWNERAAREYAEQVTRRGLVAVPDGWRGPSGANLPWTARPRRSMCRSRNWRSTEKAPRVSGWRLPSAPSAAAV